MNYLKKCVVSAIEHDIYNLDSYDLGVLITEQVIRLSDANVSGCNKEEFLRGVSDAINNSVCKDKSECK